MVLYSKSVLIMNAAQTKIQILILIHTNILLMDYHALAYTLQHIKHQDALQTFGINISCVQSFWFYEKCIKCTSGTFSGSCAG